MASRAQKLVWEERERQRKRQRKGKRAADTEDEQAQQEKERKAEEEERLKRQQEKRAKREQRKQEKMKEDEAMTPEVRERLRLLARYQAKALEAHNYLLLWKTDREAWKFKKHHQTFLLKHMFNPYVVDQMAFDILMEYIGGLQGRSVDATVKAAQTKLEEDEVQEEVLSDAEVVFNRFSEGKPFTEAVKAKFASTLTQLIHKRARSVLQVLL
ncbi:hypothetical protein PTSG_01798 [Salpingoeca rosetta]|uniref:WKF domain-containing protein n=1 Tax=Salpingoeca rosetta (strain ATCC 50818 / BSB-021) TaxID=946362 RepID=F2TYZ9_SALR5|nr:uncharacterized protein PTSG_01798 [Salpingoeca rosetta]EGD78823.1 hypothetical protein PTSG_01798 [Salpingoeca rosetta]|eukprot:XP_004997779.1 hypothetical protein PTSG_01798 [Salpingoeca rosetta]